MNKPLLKVKLQFLLLGLLYPFEKYNAVSPIIWEGNHKIGTMIGFSFSSSVPYYIQDSA
jgi:hypothetical protein